MTPARQAMSLVELLVAVALGMLVIALAWTAFVRANASTVRATARVDLHATASVIRTYLDRDLSNLAPTIACFVRCAPQVASGTGRTDTVELLFMRMVDSLAGETSAATRDQRKSDFTWVRWRFIRAWEEVGGTWKPTGGALYRSTSTPAREFTTKASWSTPGPLDDPIATHAPWTSYDGAAWLNLPRPLRDASAGIASLDCNRYGVADTQINASPSTSSGDMTDIGDLADLDRSANDRLVSSRVVDLAVGWVDAAGRPTVVTSGVAADHRIDGLYLDVTGPAGNAYRDQLAARPRMFRVSFNLTDGDGGVRQDFAFSIATPGLQPEIGR